MPNNNRYNLVAENPQSTVAAEYTAVYRTAKTYQSEAELERAFIEQLESQAYEYLSITAEADLILNLRRQLEKLNDFAFSDAEWEQFFTGEIANPNQSIAEKITTIQEDSIKNLKRDDGTVKNIYLLRKDKIHDNHLQVINQYATEDGQRANRYDVTVLINGLPLVHIELKRRGVAIAEAFNQINRYQRESFWTGSGLFEYVQVFVISNGTHTKYYSNTVRSEHIKESGRGAVKKGKRASNSFEFTSWWADAANRPITGLVDFAGTFFAKHTLLNILTRYCVFTTDKQLLEKFPVGERITGEQNQKDFIRLYGAILRLRNILTTFDEFSGNEILSERDVQDYHSAYIDLYNEFRKKGDGDKENINDDIVFEMELIKQIEINIDYILGLVKKYHEDHIKNRELLIDINKAIDSSVELRNKKDLINQFIASLDIHSVVDEDWQKYVKEKKIEELEEIIKSENLDHDETYKFVRSSFRNGSVAATGTDLAKVLPPVSRFSPGGERSKKRETVLDKLTRFFERFFDISSKVF